MADFVQAWDTHRVGAGTRLTIRLERVGGVQDVPKAQQVRERIGSSPAIAAGIGDCAFTWDPTEIFCGEYHVPVTVVETVDLATALPETINVAATGAFGTGIGQGQQTWELTGVRFEGISGGGQTDQAEDRQEEPAPTDQPGGVVGGLLGEAMAPLLVLGLLLFALTDAGQQLLESVTGGR